MKKSLYESIRQGLYEAIAYADGSADKSLYRVHIPKQVDVRAPSTPNLVNEVTHLSDEGEGNI